jgi:UDP-N-acetyl-D-glucosamine dehydrogenase
LELNLKDAIKKKKCRCSVIGLGYVGLPLAVEFAHAGLETVGVDISKEKVDMLNKGKSYIGDVTDEALAECLRSGKLEVTTDFDSLREVDTINICVPTPLRKTRDPDISYIIAAVNSIKEIIHPHQLIILESTTYPGTTEEVIRPILEETGLEVGKEFFLAFSPERVDPGNREYTTRNIPKVVGGITSKCTELSIQLYKVAGMKPVGVSSSNVAETVKLLENTFRSVNIGLVNEIALMCNKMNINVWEVIDAAATKPFGFMPFYPGPGLGGHCIPIDPFYLSWKAKMSGFESRFIELAGNVNREMPMYVVRRVSELLNENNKCVNGSKILVVGVSYKEDISDTRESPAFDIIRILKNMDADVSYYDPYVDELDGNLNCPPFEFEEEKIKKIDCAIIVTAHSDIDYRKLVDNCLAIFDARNALKEFKKEGHIVRL